MRRVISAAMLGLPIGIGLVLLSIAIGVGIVLLLARFVDSADAGQLSGPQCHAPPGCVSVLESGQCVDSSLHGGPCTRVAEQPLSGPQSIPRHCLSAAGLAQLNDTGDAVGALERTIFRGVDRDGNPFELRYNSEFGVWTQFSLRIDPLDPKAVQYCMVNWGTMGLTVDPPIDVGTDP